MSGRTRTPGRVSAVALFFAATLPLAATATAGEPLLPQPKAGDPLHGLTVEQLDRFFKGRDAFMKTFSFEEGLGPVFNQNSCSSCHNNPVGGSGTVFVTRFGYFDKMTGEFDPLAHLGGSLLQHDSINIPGCEDEIPEIANVETKRITNSALGLGLVEAIADADIIALADSGPGKVHMVEVLEDPEGPLRVGRMGWKAQVATVLTFSGDAARNEMGISNRLIPTSPAPKGDVDLLEFCSQMADPNDGPDSEGFDFIDRITDFQRFLAGPPQTPKSGMSGEAIFNQIGCADCHVPTFVTVDDNSLEDVLRNREIKPYSDFLLHNMGLLGDGIEQGDAGQLEIRTPSLWGLRMRDPMLHDGRVGGGSFEDKIRRTTPQNEGVIWWHGAFGSAAVASAQAFFALSAAEQDQLIAFLDSLGRAEFDFDGDNVIDDDDLLVLISCYTGPGDHGISPDDLCAIGDVNQDGAIDETDFAVFIHAYDGQQEPCDLWQQLADAVGPEIDVEIPAECQPEPGCTGDLNGDDVIDVSDLLILLGDWGSCPGCPADINGDNVVDVSDLLILLSVWGPCDNGGGGEPNPDSCQDHCGNQAPGGCWCDESCVGYGDCCDDACDLCGQCPVPQCEGYCGVQSPDGCWCDELCDGFGDCCGDVCLYCQDLSHCQ